jgi:hypothetical protein
MRSVGNVFCEAILNAHEAVYRTALVGVGPAGQQRPVFVVEPWPKRFPKTAAEREQLLEELPRKTGRLGQPHPAIIAAWPQAEIRSWRSARCRGGGWDRLAVDSALDVEDDR